MIKTSHLFAACMAVALAFTAGSARADGDAAAGEQLFVRCKACHLAEKGAGYRVGPNLFGVYGRICGSTQFPRYSPGMKACNIKGVVWDETTLPQYIPDAAKFLEFLTGTKGMGMVPQNLSAAQIADIIAYLKTLK